MSQRPHQRLNQLLQQSLDEQGKATLLEPAQLLHASREPCSLTLLTLSSYRFHGHFCLLGDEGADRQEQLYEQANMLCGSLKRLLGQQLAGLGMSTPNRLPAGCLEYLLEQHEPVAVARTRSNGGQELLAGLLLPFDIQLTLPPASAGSAFASETATASGELELF